MLFCFSCYVATLLLLASAGTFPEREFGVEWELKLPVAELVNCTLVASALAFQRAGLPCAVGTHKHYENPRPTWRVVYDFSPNIMMTTTQEQFPVELNSPILSGEAGLAELDVAVQAMQRIGAMIDESGLFHVHISARDLSLDSIRQVCVCFAAFEPVFDSLCAVHTRLDRNFYCKSPLKGLSAVYNTSEAVEMISSALSNLTLVRRFNDARGNGLVTGVNPSRRYHKLNVVSVFSPKHTFEFRQHQGSVDAEEVRNWVALLQRFVAGAVAGRCEAPARRPTFATFFDQVIGDASLKAYYITVREEFKDPKRRFLSANPPYHGVECDPLTQWNHPPPDATLRLWRRRSRGRYDGCEQMNWFATEDVDDEP